MQILKSRLHVMPDFDSLVGQYLSVYGVAEQKKAVVTAASEIKKAALGATEGYQVGAGAYTDKGLASAGQQELDVRTLSPIELNAKYGYDLGNQLTASKAQGMESYRSDVTALRGKEANLDAMSGAGMGLFNGIAGIGALGVGVADAVGLAPDGAGPAIAKKLGEANTWVQSKQSTGLNAHREAYRAVQDLDERDNQAEQGDGLVEALKRVGKDALSAAGNSISDPTLLSDGISSGVGSLLGGGVVAKGLKVAGKVGAASVAVGSSGPSKAAALIAGATEKAAMPAAIGAMEAGGAYQQTADQALQAGADPSKANAAGLLAAAVQLPVAVASGTLVSKFESAPFRVPSIVSAVGNVAKEGVEEGIQSGSGQLAQNVGLKTYVNPDQDLAEGVGQAAGQGALYGMGTAGALQTPGAVGSVVVEAAKTAGKAVAPLFDREGRIMDAAGAEQAAQATAAQDAAVASAPELHDQLQGVVAASGSDQAPQMAEYLTQLFDNAKFDPAEASQEAPLVQAAVQGATDRFAALRQVAQAAIDPSNSEADRLIAAAYIIKQNTQHQKLLDTDLKAAITQIGNDDPALDRLREFEDVTWNQTEHPQIRAALEAGKAALESGLLAKQFTDKAMSTPEGVQAAQYTANAIIELAGSDPTKIDSDILDVIRTQSVKAGGLVLTAEQKATLDAASAWVRATRDRVASMEGMGLSNGDQVSYEAQIQDAVGDPDKSPVQSASAKGRAVMDAMRAGDLESARIQLLDMASLAQHFQNKVQAYNTNLASGRPDLKTSFEGLPKARELGKGVLGMGNAAPVWLNLASEKSVKNAQSAAVDTRAIAELVNGLSEAFPQLEVQHVTPVSLGIDPQLTKKAAQIVEERRQGSANVTEERAKDKKVPVSSPTEIVEAVISDAKVEPTDGNVKPTPAPVEEKVKTETVPEAKPQAVVEEIASDEAKSAPQSNLIGESDGNNWFTRSFSSPDGTKSRLVGAADGVANLLIEAFASPEAFQKIVGSTSGHKLTAEIRAKYIRLIQSSGDEVHTAMEKGLAAFLAETVFKNGPTMGAALIDPSLKGKGGLIQQFVRGKAANIVENVDGELVYNDELLQSAVVAGLQWAINMATRPARELDAEAVADILGIDEESVTVDQIKALNESQWLPDAVDSLSSMITRFWGVQASPDALDGYTKGIPEGVAKEVLKGLEAAGLVRLFTIDGDGNTLTPAEVKALNRANASKDEGSPQKTYNRVALSENIQAVASLKELSSFPGAIEQVALVEPVEYRFIGEAPKSAPVYQMRNRLVKNSRQVIEAIEQRQNTPHRINQKMVDLFEGLGKELIVKLFGAGEVDETNLNKNHGRSLKSTNLSIEGAYDAMVSLLAELRNKAEQAGVSPTDMPVFYAYNSSKVGRLQMEGAHSPQASKLTREFILPTRVTMDMTQAENVNKFMLAVAQAWGQKVHKQPRSVSVSKADELSKGDFAPAMEALSSVLSGSKPDEKLVDTLKAAFGDELSPAAVHAAMELARLRQTKDVSAFETDLYVEADGVTDGPINALVHLVTGPFTDTWIGLVAKGGLFLGSPKMTLNRFVGDGAPAVNRVDLYETATDNLVSLMAGFREGLPADVSPLMNTLLGAMDGLLGKDLDFTDGVLNITRGLAKNPLTVTIYGSGANGIAAKIVGAMTEAFYEELSKGIRGEPNDADAIYDRLNDLSMIVARRRKEGLYTKDLSGVTDPTEGRNDAAKMTFSKGQLANLQENVLNLFVTPLQEAIENTIEGTKAGRDVARDTAQVQSIVLKYEFRRMVTERMAEREASDPTYKTSDGLSQSDYTKIYKALTKISPLIKTGGQILFAAGSEKSDGASTELSRSLSGDMATPPRIYAPAAAGVKGIPFLVIASGDGQMMLNLFTGEQAPKGMLDVFDGVHTKLDTLDEDGVVVNQSVYDAWMNNPLAAVNTSFQEFLGSYSLDQANVAMVDELTKALKLKEGADLAQAVMALGRSSQEAADNAQARHAVMARVEMSVDHMAGIEAPFQSKGESLEGLNEQEIAHRLNEMMDEELEKIRNPKAKGDAKFSPATEKTESPEEIQGGAAANLSAKGELPPVVVTSASGLAKLVNGLKIPAEQKNLMKEIVRSLQKTGWEVVQGTKADLGAYALAKGHTPHYGRRREVLKGYAVPSQQRIYLHTDQGADAETLVHELIHASVTEKILAHYRGETNPEVAETVTNLETLMAEWKAMSGIEQSEAYTNARSQMEAELSNPKRSSADNRAAELDEFLAWNLSNQDLIKVAQATKVANPLVRVVKRVLIALKNLIWGRSMSPMVRSDMYSALRFNASVLINASPTLQARHGVVARYMSVAYGNNQRLSDLQKRLSRKITNFINEEADPRARMLRQDRVNQTVADISSPVQIAFDTAGFTMNPQESLAFKALMSVFVTQTKLDPASLGRVQELYTYVNQTLTPDNFITEKLNQAQEYAAGRKLQVLRGTLDGQAISGNDAQGRSALLPAFLALAMVNDEFRQVLSGMDVPKSDRKPADSLDNILSNYGAEGIDLVSKLISGEGRNKPNIRAAIDALTDRLAENIEDQESTIARLSNPVSAVIDGANSWVVDKMDRGSRKAIKAVDVAKARVRNKFAKGALEATKVGLAIANAEEAKQIGEAWMANANNLKFPKAISEALGDLVGRTESNAPLFDLIKPIRAFVQAARQNAKEYVPGLIASKFKKELSNEQWGHLSMGLAKTDLSVLIAGRSVKAVLQLLVDRTKRTAEIQRLERAIELQVGAQAWQQIKPKAEQLAEFMTTRKKGLQLQRNALAVAGQFGTSGANKPSDSLVNEVDQLVTLYALQSLTAPVVDALVSLVKDEAEGVSYTLEYLLGQRSSELAKVVSDVAKANHYKGYIPTGAGSGAQLIVVENSEGASRRMMGFKPLAPYKGSSAEQLTKQRSYYLSPVSSRPTFSAGAMQNVRQTASGVDPVTGFTHDGVMTAGRIVGPRGVQQATRNMGRASAQDEELMPIYDGLGNIRAYERGVDPAQEALLEPETHLARMLGTWRGRQDEEKLAVEYNTQLINRLHDMWDNAGSRSSEFVNLFDRKELDKDPVLADAVRLLTPEALEHIQEAFGGDGFMVRRDLINDAIGYRGASIGDAWTGNMRFPPKTVEAVRKLAIGFMGADAYRNLVVAEKFTQNLVSEARQTIVVRSVVVPAANFVANILQMLGRGVKLERIVRDMPKKLVEINAYVNRRHRELELEADLRAAGDSVVRTRTVEAELQSIRDANSRMSIWPLIKAGEFTSISDAGSLEKEELSLFEGKLSDYIEQKLNKLPKGLKTVARYGMITQDTALFQGLSRSVQYGDFLAKAVRYDHLIQEKKMSSVEALASIGEEYINYDRLSGRTRAAIENLGLLWFYNFKIRSVKVAVAMIRENPVHGLLAGLVPGLPIIGEVGSVLGDNVVSMLVDGRIHWSMGAEMGLNSWQMNPIVNALDAIN